MAFKVDQEVILVYSDRINDNEDSIKYSTTYKVRIIENRRAEEMDGIDQNFQGRFMLHRYEVLEIISGTGHPEIKEDFSGGGETFNGLESNLLPQVGQIRTCFLSVNKRKKNRGDIYPNIKFSRLPK
jgi:hypothetical protein